MLRRSDGEASAKDPGEFNTIQNLSTEDKIFCLPALGEGHNIERERSTKDGYGDDVVDELGMPEKKKDS
ncbi:hypothetical protein ACH5RR_011341 [Cinchona calisaya]|uniref:Uncharacterized protein n=1 Tax=Cinchona calisaya TaxID=153742 RepID=A0ABD3A4L4_9GENT